MSNKIKGEITLNINGLDYPMIVDMGVISEFESETGADFLNLSISAMNALIKTRQLEYYLDRAEYMTKVIPRKEATWLFYLAAKKANSQVEFGEMEEAVFLEGGVEGGVDETKQSYPILFAALTEFAIVGDVKKKTVTSENEKSS